MASRRPGALASPAKLASGFSAAVGVTGAGSGRFRAGKSCLNFFSRLENDAAGAAVTPAVAARLALYVRRG